MDDTVESAVPGGGRFDQPRGLVLVGHIRRFVADLPGTLAGLRGDLVGGGRQFVGITTGQHGVAAGSDHGDRNTLADPAASTGDQECSIR